MRSIPYVKSRRKKNPRITAIEQSAIDFVIRPRRPAIRTSLLSRHHAVIPFIHAQINNVTFPQDNARPHVARVVRDYLTQQNVDVLPWPAVSPDLSPIERIWAEMERRLRHLQNQPVRLAEMGQALIHMGTISHKHSYHID